MSPYTNHKEIQQAFLNALQKIQSEEKDCPQDDAIQRMGLFGDNFYRKKKRKKQSSPFQISFPTAAAALQDPRTTAPSQSSQ